MSVVCEIRRLKTALRRGDPVAAGNIAVAYRDLGDLRRAFHWWRSAATAGDGDAWVDVGYCLQYRIGVRRDVAAAASAYRTAIRARWITRYVWEEAHYHLALLLLDGGAVARMARNLLRMTSADADYPEATALLAALQSGSTDDACRCGGRLRRVKGQVVCPRHTAPGRRRL